MPWLPRVLALALALAPASCQRSSRDASVAPEPTTEDDAADDEGAPLDTQTFVSTARNDAPRERAPGEPESATAVEGFAVVTPEAARELAEAAVADRLDPKKSWRPSPVLPAAWPTTEPAVAVYFYPMAAHQSSMNRYTLFTPAFRVTVSLVDGATEVKALPKPRALGTIEDTRPSSLERRELDLSENALVRRLVGVTSDAGENPYWGYLKFLHEHPRLGKDLEKRASSFIGWVRKKARR